MKFPYGICDFYHIITEGYFYVDRTDRIRLIEEAGKHLLLVRPRRFGKSLLLSMLENYYDVAKADGFNTLFGHLSIGRNPTSRHNQYFVLKLDFSAVSSLGDAHEIQQALNDHINGCIEQFIAHYHNLLEYDIEINETNALRSFQSVLAAIQQTPYQLYLLIDEYDNFGNEVMMGSGSVSRQRYETLLYGEGVLKALFKAIKSASAGLGLDRVFITGVSPVVLSDVTSGYNIAKNIYLDPEFNDICGFWESEIEETLNQIVGACDMPLEKATEALAMMRIFYNGYCFGYDAAGYVYNPTLVLYFLEHLQRRCQYPRNLLDSNLAMDRDKITYISRLPGGERIILDAIDEETSLRIAQLADRFGVEDMLDASKDDTFMISLLYYFGVLTFGGDTELGKLILKIPNLVVRKLYVERIQEMLLPDLGDKNEALRVGEALFSTGDMQPLCDFIEERYFKVFDNRDYRWTNELTVKTAFLTLLFNDTFYIMDSETELERGYADLTMILRPDMRRYPLLDILMEFKYIGLKDLGLSGAEVKQMGREELKALAPIQKKLAESKANLRGYRQALEVKYGNELRLHSYIVVALGFDRLVWEAV